MRTLSVILLAVWLCIFGAINATWISMSVHNFGILTFIVGLVILVIEFFFYGTGEGRNWFRRPQ